MAPVYQGLFLMTSNNRVVDLDLVDKVAELIPDHTWPRVIQGLSACLVDYMSSDFLLRLTGSPTDFEKAEEILICFYSQDGFHKEVIADAFKAIGTEQTLYTLDLWQLDKIPDDNATIESEHGQDVLQTSEVPEVQ